MSVIGGVHVLSFDEWKRTPSVKEMELQLENCEQCLGEGTHECDCGDIHDCHSCDGEGKKDNLDKIYRNALRDELQKLVDWREGNAKKVKQEKGKVING